MRIVYDYPPYKRALRSFWPMWDGRCVCAVDEKGILGGCGFFSIPSKMGDMSGYLTEGEASPLYNFLSANNNRTVDMTLEYSETPFPKGEVNRLLRRVFLYALRCILPLKGSVKSPEYLTQGFFALPFLLRR